MRLTDKEMADMPVKSTRDAEVIALYRDNDFIDAYALHTKRRIEKTGYKCAIGADDANWDSHGELQRDFLISQGLKPHHSLLEIGCGTGRLARKVVPYLNQYGYHGVDISEDAIEVALELSKGENSPSFWVGEIPESISPIDYIWAFSVFIHLPQDIMESVMARARKVMHADSRFFWAYVPEPKAYRSGCKQFRHTLEDYKRAAANSGLTFDDVPDWIAKAGYTEGRWSGSQRVAVSRKIV